MNKNKIIGRSGFAGACLPGSHFMSRYLKACGALHLDLQTLSGSLTFPPTPSSPANAKSKRADPISQLGSPLTKGGAEDGGISLVFRFSASTCP